MQHSCHVSLSSIQCQREELRRVASQGCGPAGHRGNVHCRQQDIDLRPHVQTRHDARERVHGRRPGYCRRRALRLQLLYGTILAYGQTLSGKTHTMDGVLLGETQRGIIPGIVIGIIPLRVRVIQSCEPGLHRLSMSGACCVLEKKTSKQVLFVS